MKRLTHHLVYPGATIDSVATMLGDRTFREKVGRAQHVLRQTVTISPDGEGKVVEMEQGHSTRGVPGFARKVVGDETLIVSREDWSSPSEATVEVTIPGKPGSMEGTIRIVEDAVGATETVDLDISVGIPLVGGRIEGLLADLMTNALSKENEVGREWLGASG